MDKLFRIGTFCFRLCCPEEITPPPNFLLFETEQGEPDYTYEIRIAETLPEPQGRIIARRPDLTVYETPGGEGRLIGIKGRDSFYGCYQELSEQRAEIVLAADGWKELHIDPVFTSLLALERQMVLRDSLILHCAYIEDRGEAILFSAPSETGKTTQAGLWEKYRGTRTVNGDRALLRKYQEKWTAGGWPVCGTSEVCHDEQMPIRAIVLLRQAKENQVKRLPPAQAFLLLFGQLTVNGWNREHGIKSVLLAEQLVQEVPVYQLGCTISEEAVSCLAAALEEEDHGTGK